MNCPQKICWLTYWAQQNHLQLFEKTCFPTCKFENKLLCSDDGFREFSEEQIHTAPCSNAIAPIAAADLESGEGTWTGSEAGEYNPSTELRTQLRIVRLRSLHLYNAVGTGLSYQNYFPVEFLELISMDCLGVTHTRWLLIYRGPSLNAYHTNCWHVEE